MAYSEETNREENHGAGPVVHHSEKPPLVASRTALDRDTVLLFHTPDADMRAQILQLPP